MEIKQNTMMKNQVLFFAVWYYTGLLKLAIWWRQRHRQRLIILNYHRASGGDLRNHLLYLRRHYRIVHLEEALEELYATRKPAKKRHDRRTMLAVTFDDGHHDIYTHAFPLARELKVPITNFLIPNYMESQDCFWWLAGDCLVEQTRVDTATIEDDIHNLVSEHGRATLAQAIYTRTRNAQSVADREAYLSSMRDILEISSVVLTEQETVVTWDEVREMEQSGWGSFGAHTMHHPVLGYLKDPLEVQYEVAECRAVLEQQLGHPVSLFAYPIGQPEHIGQEAPRAVQEAGYASAVTTIYGINTPESNPFQLHRIGMDVRWHWLLMAAETAGIRRFFLPMFSFVKNIVLVGQKLRRIPLPSFQPVPKETPGEAL